jgi:hypothetical protein
MSLASTDIALPGTLNFCTHPVCNTDEADGSRLDCDIVAEILLIAMAVAEILLIAMSIPLDLEKV